MQTFHIRQKWQMIIERGGSIYAKCDYCGGIIGDSGDKHELISRGHLPRLLQEPILHRFACAYLCQDCHRSWHDGDKKNVMEQKLWESLIKRYGDNPQFKSHFLSMVEKHSTINLNKLIIDWISDPA